MATTTAVGASSTTVTESAATETGTAARRETTGLAAVIIAAESAGAGAALASRSTVTASGVVVSIERPDGGAGAIVNSTRATNIVAAIEIAVGIHAAPFTAVIIVDATVLAAAIEIIAIVESAAVGVITSVIVNGVVAVPIESPTRPAPTVSSKKTDAKRGAEGEIGTAKPNSGIGIPTRPSNDWATVNGPWIVGGNVNDFRIGGLNGDGRVLVGDGLLRSGLEISRFLRAAAHDLNGVHHVGLLVVVGIAERGGPGKIFVHVAEDGRKGSERFNAGIPGFLVDSLGQGVTFQIGMLLDPAISLDDLFGKSGCQPGFARRGSSRGKGR